MYTINFTKQNWLQGIPILAIIAFSIWVAHFIHKFGIGISPDTIQYYSAGQNFFAGKGFFISDYRNYGSDLIPMTQWPPLYAFMLAAIDQFIHQLGTAAFILNTLSLCASALLAYILLKFQLDVPTPIALVGALAVVVSSPILMIHAWGWSEPLFINFMLLSWLCLIQYDRSNQSRWLTFSAIVTGAAMMTRYAGIALLLGNISAVLLISGSLKNKIRRIVIYGSISAAPLLLWFIRNNLLASQLSNRNLVFHPIPLIEFLKMLTDILAWAYPKSSSFPYEYGIPILLAFGTIYLFVVGFRFLHKENYSSINVSAFPFITLGLFAIIYLSFIVISRTFFDAYIPLDERIVSPFFVCLSLIMIALCGTLLSTIQPTRLRLILAIALSLAFLIFLIGEGNVNKAWFYAYAKDGLGYANDSWTHSPTIQVINSLPEDAILISNAPDVIDLVSSKKTYRYPTEVNPITGLHQEDLDNQYSLLQTYINAHSPIYIVHFIDIGRYYLVSEEDMIEKFNLELLMQLKDGRIYTIAK